MRPERKRILDQEGAVLLLQGLHVFSFPLTCFSETFQTHRNT